MLNRLRGRLAPALGALGRAFARTGLPPAFWTLLSLGLALAAAAAYAALPWHAGAAGGALLLASGFFDVVDGQVARATGRQSARGAFLDSVSDKAAEVAVFFGILASGAADPALVFLAATLSLLVSYARSRAESAGVAMRGVGVGERAERLLVVAAAGILGVMEPGLAVVCALAGATFAHRAAATYAAQRGA